MFYTGKAVNAGINHAHIIRMNRELSPRGVNQVVEYLLTFHKDKELMLVDMGAGLGKAALQVFLQFGQRVQNVVGVEIVPERLSFGFKALKCLQSERGGSVYAHKTDKVDTLCVGGRHLQLRCANVFDQTDLFGAHVVILETSFPESSFSRLKTFLQSFGVGTVFVSYVSFEVFLFFFWWCWLLYLLCFLFVH
jgi:hypothetical protein